MYKILNRITVICIILLLIFSVVSAICSQIEAALLGLILAEVIARDIKGVK